MPRLIVSHQGSINIALEQSTDNNTTMEGQSLILKTEIKTEADTDHSPSDYLKIKMEEDGDDEVDCMVTTHDDNSATGHSPNIESWPGDKNFRLLKKILNNFLRF